MFPIIQLLALKHQSSASSAIYGHCDILIGYVIKMNLLLCMWRQDMACNNDRKEVKKTVKVAILDYQA